MKDAFTTVISSKDETEARLQAIIALKERIIERAKELTLEIQSLSFSMPIAIILVIDSKNGGDSVSEEIQKRFRYLDLRTKNLIDFYFPGWSLDESGDHKFDLNSFIAYLDVLKASWGITEFGGYADLIFLNLKCLSGEISLDLSDYIHIDLSRFVKEGNIPTLGWLFEKIIQAAEDIGTNSSQPTWEMSDKLGLIVAKESLVSSFFKRFGELIGANLLKQLAVRNVGGSKIIRIV
jgi:hypothetical protein